MFDFPLYPSRTLFYVIALETFTSVKENSLQLSALLPTIYVGLNLLDHTMGSAFEVCDERSQRLKE